MAFLGQQFDPNTVEPSQAFEPLPSGEYPAIITDSEMKPTKSGAGHYLELTFQIIDGPMKNRLTWSRLNLDNPNPKAVEIAQRDLSAILHAVGQMQAITDSAVLHNRPLVIRVEYVKADGDKRKNDGNEVKAYKRLEGVAAPAPQASPFQKPATPAANAAAVPAWAQKPAA